MRRKPGNSFPTTQGKVPSSRPRRRKRCSSECGRDSRAASQVETGMSGNFLSCSKGAKDPLEVPEFRCEKPRDASAEIGLISPGGENLLDFLELRQVRSTYNGDHRHPLWWPRKGQSPCELLGGLSGFLYRRFRGLRPCVESLPEPEYSSPVMTWILGYFWSLPRGVSPHLEWGHARAHSSQAVAAGHASLRVDQGICRFPSRLSHEAFPQGCPTCHRDVSRSSA